MDMIGISYVEYGKISQEKVVHKLPSSHDIGSSLTEQGNSI
jgi:hypothetical protein